MKTQTRILVLLLAIAAAGAPALAQPQPPKPPKPPAPPKAALAHGKYEQTERRTLHVPNVTELELANISGDIVIAAGGGTDARIDVVKRGYGDTEEEAREQLAMLDVRLLVNDRGRGEVRAGYYRSGPRGRKFRSSADYTVTAPAGTVVRVNTVSGSVRATKMKGDLWLQSVSGDVTLESPGRVTAAKSVSGDVRVSGAALDGPLEVSSVSGTVWLEALKARRIDASSVSGGVVLKDVTCEHASVQTISGDLEYRGGIVRGGRYELQAHSGNIRFVVTGHVGFDVEANSFSGSIKSTLPITNEAASRGDERPPEWRGPLPQRAAFRGTWGDGAARVELSTFSGDILITK